MSKEPSHPAHNGPFDPETGADVLIAAPLERLALPAGTVPPGTRLWVVDGRGRVYVDRILDSSPEFRVAGALGWQRAELAGPHGGILGAWSFRVECRTAIDDGEAGFGALLRDLHATMLSSSGGDGLGTALVDGKMYRYFIRWLRDHTHTLKGMKYFSGELKTGLELYADTQRADGMVYDRIAPKADVQGWRDHTFRRGDFVRTLNPGTPNSYTLQRIPVENDVEYLFVECLYRTWQATGDTPWMARHLDHARRAVAYATRDPYRWSTKQGLLKRGYTIDTWDFLHQDDSALTLGDNVCDLERTTFGIMHGDNTGMAMACRMLADMLRAAGRGEEAPACENLAADLLARLEALAWDGRGYYRHHVSEDPSFHRDVGGTDEAGQVSLSNAYALNRGIGAGKCRAILETYRRIRREMPEASPGEFFTIYPPFEKGFAPHNDLWQYMNGGVCTIVAGELARGAFAQGDDAYGVDILRRLKGLADRHGGHLHVCFHGNPETRPPPRTFTPLDLSGVANVTAAYREEGGWGDPGNDLSRLPTGEVCFCHVPFRVCPDGRGIGIARDRTGFARELHVPVGGAHAAMYLFHTLSHPDSPAAELDVVYNDGGTRRLYLAPGRQFDNWFMPGSEEKQRGGHAPKLRKGRPEYQLAWRGGNDTFRNVGVFLWGWDNPRPKAAIRELIFRATDTACVTFTPGITFSDQPVWFPHSDLSFGIPDAWGAAAVVYALVEGLAGVVDAATMFESVELSPRWAAAGVDRVSVSVCYPAGGGYVAYAYRHDPEAHRITLTVATGGDRVHCRLPLPEGMAEGVSCRIDGAPAPVTRQRDAPRMVEFLLEGPGPHEVEMNHG